MGNMVCPNFKVCVTPQFEVLTQDQRQQIYFGALEILARTGAQIHDERTLELLQQNGCQVEGTRVYFPRALVEWAVAAAPSYVTIYDRNGRPAMYLGGNNVYFGPGPTNTFHLDPFTGERRKPLKTDKADVARVVDALPNIDYAMDLGTPSDVTSTLADVHAFDAMVRNTEKPIVHWGFDVEQYEDIIKMAAAVKGGLEQLARRPFIVLYSESSPPLVHSKEAIAKALYAAEMGIPVIYTPCVMAGATAPATMAGTLAITVAESLAGLTAVQLLKKGAPFIMGGVISIMDMSSTILSYGAPEFNLLQAALAEVAHHIGLPVFGTGGCIDSKVLDAQAAAEAAQSILLSALSGANLVHDCGYMEFGSTGSVELLVLDDEIIGYVKRIMRGINIDDESLALEVIDRVGPGGHFLGEDHTMAHFRTETWFPTLCDRRRYDDWVAHGSTSLEQRLKEKTQAIIRGHQPRPLPDHVLARLDEIVSAAEEREAAKAKKRR